MRRDSLGKNYSSGILLLGVLFNPGSNTSRNNGPEFGSVRDIKKIDLTCPSCGSKDATLIPLLAIPTRYYRCGYCSITFRDPTQAFERPDVERFNRELEPSKENGKGD